MVIIDIPIKNVSRIIKRDDTKPFGSVCDIDIESEYGGREYLSIRSDYIVFESGLMYAWFSDIINDHCLVEIKDFKIDGDYVIFLDDGQELSPVRYTNHNHSSVYSMYKAITDIYVNGELEITQGKECGFIHNENANEDSMLYHYADNRVVGVPYNKQEGMRKTRKVDGNFTVKFNNGTGKYLHLTRNGEVVWVDSDLVYLHSSIVFNHDTPKANRGIIHNINTLVDLLVNGDAFIELDINRRANRHDAFMTILYYQINDAIQSKRENPVYDITTNPEGMKLVNVLMGSENSCFVRLLDDDYNATFIHFKTESELTLYLLTNSEQIEAFYQKDSDKLIEYIKNDRLSYKA